MRNVKTFHLSGHCIVIYICEDYKSRLTTTEVIDIGWTECIIFEMDCHCVAQIGLELLNSRCLSDTSSWIRFWNYRCGPLHLSKRTPFPIPEEVLIFASFLQTSPYLFIDSFKEDGKHEDSTDRRPDVARKWCYVVEELSILWWLYQWDPQDADDD